MIKDKKISRLIFITKTAVGILAFWYLYKQIFIKQDMRQITDFYLETLRMTPTILMISFAILLMPVNWGIEAYKWKKMIGKIENISFRRSVLAVFSGVTVSAFIPNRAGEYIGRVFHLRQSDKIQAGLITIIGSMAQLLVTILAGSISLIIYIRYFVKPESFFFYLMVTLIVIFVMLCTVIFFNSAVISYLLKNIPFLKKHEKYTGVFSMFSMKELGNVFLLSLFRYVIFAFQFFILLQAFHVITPFLMTMAMISLSFFVMTMVPTGALTDLGIRSSVSLYYISLVSANNELGIVTASFSLWLINIAVPALAGLLIVFLLRIEK